MLLRLALVLEIQVFELILTLDAPNQLWCQQNIDRMMVTCLFLFNLGNANVNSQHFYENLVSYKKLHFPQKTNKES